MSDIFGYPVQVTAEEIKNETGIDIAEEYGAGKVKRFLHETHFAVYDGGIYATGDRNMKENLIAAHEEEVTLPIKRALIYQAMYLHEQGNAATESGITITADGNKAVISKQDLQAKTLCIAAVNALKACTIPIVYAGG